jgi:hypothetical protein
MQKADSNSSAGTKADSGQKVQNILSASILENPMLSAFASTVVPQSTF